MPTTWSSVLAVVVHPKGSRRLLFQLANHKSWHNDYKLQADVSLFTCGTMSEVCVCLCVPMHNMHNALHMIVVHKVYSSVGRKLVTCTLVFPCPGAQIETTSARRPRGQGKYSGV